MPHVYIPGNPQDARERRALLQAAFDEFMGKVPIEQRRFLRRFGFTESEIDEALRDPDVLTWTIKP